jgi:hypothetical protein
MTCTLCNGPVADDVSETCPPCAEYEQWRLEEAQADIAVQDFKMGLTDESGNWLDEPSEPEEY